MNTQAFIQGFTEQCRAYGVNPVAMAKYAENLAAATAVTPPKTVSRAHYVVQPKDTVSGIAKRLGISEDTINQFNPGLDPLKLQIGQKLWLEGDQSALQDWNPETMHKVQKGDTFSGLAKAWDTTPEMIQKANPGVDPLKLRIGSLLNKVF